MSRRQSVPLLLASLALAAVFAGCGESGPPRSCGDYKDRSDSEQAAYVQTLRKNAGLTADADGVRNGRLVIFTACIRAPDDAPLKPIIEQSPELHSKT